MKQKIYLFRHGELNTQYKEIYVGHTDAELSKYGLEQNKNSFEFLKESNCKIYTSDLKRTYSGIGNPRRIPELNEINFGLWEGLSWAEIEQKFPQKSKSFYNLHLYLPFLQESLLSPFLKE